MLLGLLAIACLLCLKYHMQNKAASSTIFKCIFLFAEGDWLSYYKRKLSLRAVLVGKKKGRTIKALRERTEKLLSVESTRHIGRLLQQYLEKVVVASNWRGGGLISSLEDGEIAAQWNILQTENTTLPADVCQALVHRSFDRSAEVDLFLI